MHSREGNALGLSRRVTTVRAMVKWNNHVFCETSQPCSYRHVLSEETRENIKDERISFSGDFFDKYITRCWE